MDTAGWALASLGLVAATVLTTAVAPPNHTWENNLSSPSETQPSPPVFEEPWLPPLSTAIEQKFTRPPHPYGAGHRGVDYHSVPGDLIVAPQAGTITFAGVVAHKPVVVINHGEGWISSLEPAEALVEVGTPVSLGSPLATVVEGLAGHCGDATCLHWGVRHHRKYIDPQTLTTPQVVLLPSRPHPLRLKPNSYR